YEDRLGYTSALVRLGARVEIFRECLGSRRCRFGSANFAHSAVVVGGSKLVGTSLSVPDRRAGCSCLIAALAAEGESTMDGASLLSRGYEALVPKLVDIGADVDVD